MIADQLRLIKPNREIEVVFNVPPSKSYTNRALITAALAHGESMIINPSSSDDTLLLINALSKLGISIRSDHASLHVTGSGGTLAIPSQPLYVGNAGTVFRFLAALATIVHGKTTLTADPAMNHRPIDPLLAVLDSMGAQCHSTNGHPPVTINGTRLNSGQFTINSSLSSQFVSALLLISPFASAPIDLSISGIIRSAPYIRMTVRVMQAFGVNVTETTRSHFFIEAPQHYSGTTFKIEGDATAASYFFAAAAITKGKARVSNLSLHTLQGDIAFINLLSEMGCRIDQHEEEITVRGDILHGITADMSSIPDCVPSLAIVACFAEEPTTMINIGHLRYKETDRLTALATELRKLGAEVIVQPETLKIIPHTLHGGTIETYNDHRMAMSFAIAGLMVNGIAIRNPGCVSKSFPTFWDEFKKLEQ
jgi:3-phosphoshikimate 1-carboxyvinyltransferase